MAHIKITGMDTEQGWKRERAYMRALRYQNGLRVWCEKCDILGYQHTMCVKCRRVLK